MFKILFMQHSNNHTENIFLFSSSDATVTLKFDL